MRNNPYNTWASWDDPQKVTLPPKNSWAGWTALMRLPNLFTVPGDAMAGLTVAALAAGRDLPMTWYLLVIGGAAWCFYVFGLLVNDLVDFNEDAIMRPERPLPSGQVGRGLVIAVMLLLPVAGLGLAWLVSIKALGVAIILLPLIVMYNMLSKHVTVVACVNMGACRALAFLLGVAPTEWLGIPGLLGLGWGGYIALVTLVARHDERPANIGSTAWWPVIPGVVLAGGVNALAWYLPAVPPPLRSVGIPLLTVAFLLG
ncbi:MAG: UbiA family prenyltransferase, partial [bacterium]